MATYSPLCVTDLAGNEICGVNPYGAFAYILVIVISGLFWALTVYMILVTHHFAIHLFDASQASQEGGQAVGAPAGGPVVVATPVPAAEGPPPPAGDEKAGEAPPPPPAGDAVEKV